MKERINRTEAQKQINEFFAKSNFKPEEMKKIKHMAMKYKIKLKEQRKLFCKKCLSPMKGRLSISKTHKTVICQHCGFKNKIKLSS